MKTIAVCNKKGGVGKTTTSLNVAARLAQLGYKTLLIDLDAQGSLTESLAVSCNSILNIARLFEAEIQKINEERKEELIRLSILDIKENLYLIPANDELTVTKEQLITKTSREYILKKLVKKIEKIANFDYVIIDCPPSVDSLTINAFVAADSLIIPMVPYYLEYQGFVSFYSNIQEIKDDINPKLRIQGILLNRYQQHQNLSKKVKEALEQIKEECGVKIFDAKISQCIKAAEAPLAGTDIFEYAPKSKTAEEYALLVDEIMEQYL